MHFSAKRACKKHFLPLFKNEIPGFSLEERTVPEYWWSDDPEVDPWKWREIIARSGRVAYGKFFDRKAGFISKEWLPCFVNYRRDGYDFDALWEDGKASARQKKIMDLFAEEFEDEEYFSNELKQKAGFSKDGDKGFEGIITGLQMQTYLCVHDFRQRRNRIRDMNTVILVSCQMNREYQHPMFTQQLSSVIMVQEKV